MAARSSTEGAAAPARAAIVAETRRWIGTPYHHQASLRGVGCDCFGLVRGVWRAFYGAEPAKVPAYSRDWGEARGVETMLETGRRHLVERGIGDAEPGDVIVFRMRHGVAKHAGILATSGTFIHAHEGVPVSEVAFDAWWRPRVAAVFAFPGTL